MGCEVLGVGCWVWGVGWGAGVLLSRTGGVKARQPFEACEVYALTCSRLLLYPLTHTHTHTHTNTHITTNPRPHQSPPSRAPFSALLLPSIYSVYKYNQLYVPPCMVLELSNVPKIHCTPPHTPPPHTPPHTGHKRDTHTGRTPTKNGDQE